MVNRRAFTLVEMLAALTLSAALMVAVMSMVGAMARTKVALKATAPPPERPEDVLRMLKLDLTNSRSVRQDKERFMMLGHAGLQRQTLEVVHRPVEVTYSVREVAGEPWLVRRQRAAGTPGGGWSELLAPGVSKLLVQPFNPEEPEAEPLEFTKEPSPVPGMVLVTIEFVDGARPPLTEVIYSR